MSLFSWNRSEIEAVRIDEDLSTELYDRARNDLPILGIRPYRGDDGLVRGERLLKSLHDDEWSKIRAKNRSDAHAFELLYTDSDEILQFRFAPGSEDAKRQMLRQLNTYYPDSDIMELSPQFMDVPVGKYVAGARLKLMESNYYYPIKHYKIETEDFEQDPYDSITSEMVGAPERANADVLVQIVVRPAISHHPRDSRNWFSGIPDTLNKMGEEKTSFRWGAIIEEAANAVGDAAGGTTEEVDFSQTVNLDDDDVYQVVKKQYGEKAYHVNIRIIAVSDDPDVATSRVEKTAGMYRKFYNSKNRQGFRTVPYTEAKLRDFLHSAASREWVDRNIVFPVDTATGVCHVPTDLNTQQADYSMTTAGKGVPPRTPRFDYESFGLDRATSALEEKHRAMLSDTNPPNPVWYGFGKKNGTEAGVEPEILRVHQFVGGSTGTGKTTLLTNYFRQIMQRGHGGLFFDPKGDDADDVISLIPEGREDDLIYIDIGADVEYEIGFNFLEVPLRNPDPNSASFDAAVEALADDLESLLAQAGGGQWHARMSGITRSVVRGLARWQVETDRDVTMLDLYFALLDSDGRQQYADMMSGERIDWIEEYAQRVLADIDQDAVEPLIRRLKEWVESGTTRRVASHPTSTISIEEAVRSGKIIVVRNRSSSGSAKRMIATALIRRLWIAIREQTHSDDEPDPPDFYAVIDEFDKIVSKESEIHNILREARAFGLSLTLSCQNLETGRDDSIGLPEGVRRAIQGNCKTFLTFDPGDPKDARAIAPQHSPDITAEDVGELSKYHIYMRTHDDHDEKTDSYKVETLPPAKESLAVRSPVETESLMAESQERYGAPRRTTEDIKRDSVFYGDTPDDEEDTDDFEVNDTTIAQACKAVFDQSIRHDNPGGWIPLNTCADRIRDYLPDAPITTSAELWGNLLDHIPDSHLKREDRDGDIYLKCTETGQTSIFASGSAQNAGGGAHRLLLKESYVPLTELGFRVSIPDQAGEEQPDALATLGDIDLLNMDDNMSPGEVADRVREFRDEYPLVARLSDAKPVHVEAESTTGTTQPSATIQNVAQSLSKNRRCLLVCREEVAGSVANTLDEKPRMARHYQFQGEEFTRYYNLGNLTIDGETIYRPGDAHETVWLKDSNEYVLADSDGNEYARFDDVSGIVEKREAYPASGADVDENGNWSPVKKPAIPELLGADIDPEMWGILVVDDGELSVYEGGEIQPIESLTESRTTGPFGEI